MGPVYTFNFLPSGLFLGISGGGGGGGVPSSSPKQTLFQTNTYKANVTAYPPPTPGIFSVKNEHYQLLT